MRERWGGQKQTKNERQAQKNSMPHNRVPPQVEELLHTYMNVAHVSTFEFGFEFGW